jgi:hypothetical protein
LQEFSGENSYQDQLKIVVGDELLRDLGDPMVRTIKIDVEGFERAVLLGLGKTFQKNRPLIVVEITPKLEDSFQNIDQLLAVLPPKYKVLELFFDAQEWCKGKYVVRRRTGNLTSVTTLVLYPSEKEKRLPFNILSEGTTQAEGDGCSDQYQSRTCTSTPGAVTAFLKASKSEPREWYG